MVAFALDVAPILDDCYAYAGVRFEDVHLAAFGGAVEPQLTRLRFPSEIHREQIRLVFQTAGDRHDPHRREHLLNLVGVVELLVGAAEVVTLHAMTSRSGVSSFLRAASQRAVNVKYLTEAAPSLEVSSDLGFGLVGAPA